MKLTIICLVIVFITSCVEKQKKIYIKSVKISNEVRVDWYVYSSITNLAPDYLQISTYDKTFFFSSFFLTDINFKNDTLFVSLWKNEYKKVDLPKIRNIKIIVDTLGEPWNGGISRVGRLREMGIDILRPHFKDVYCPNGEGCIIK